MSKADISIISRINKVDYCRYLDIMVELIVTMPEHEVIIVY